MGPCVEAAQPHLSSVESNVLPEQFFLSGLVLGTGKCQGECLNVGRNPVVVETGEGEMVGGGERCTDRQLGCNKKRADKG